MEADSFDNVPSVPVREELDDVIHIEEVRKAVKQMKCNKASGGDGIPAEVYKHGGDNPSASPTSSVSEAMGQ